MRYRSVKWGDMLTQATALQLRQVRQRVKLCSSGPQDSPRAVLLSWNVSPPSRRPCGVAVPATDFPGLLRSRMHELLSKFNDAFVMVTYHVRHLDGHGLASCSAAAPVATEAWNVARRIGAKQKKGGMRTPTGSSPLTPVESIVNNYTHSTCSAVSDYFRDGGTTW